MNNSIRFFPIAIAVSLAITVSGCASVSKQAISTEEKSAIQGQTVAMTSRQKPDFAAMTPSKAVIAMLGVIAAISEGNSIIEKNDVSDPADLISSNLAKSLEMARSVKVVATPIPVTSEDVSQIASSVENSAAYAIDVKTINWSINYFSFDWTHYRVFYTASARLINTKSKAVVATGFCKRIPETNSGAPTYDELLENQAARLKRELAIAAEDCVATLKKEMLGI